MYERKQHKPLPFGGIQRGMSDVSPKFMDAGYAKTLRNLFFKAGARSRYGWTTIANGLTASWNTWTWDNTTKDTGYLVGFQRVDAGKIAVFEKRYFFDTEADEEDFDVVTTKVTASDASQDFVGVFEFANVFYVFSHEKIYSVNMTTGAKTAAVDFSTDLGAAYDHVIQMFDRFGKIWAVSDTNSKVFWADDLGVVPGAGDTITDQQIDPLLLDEWQLLYDGTIAASPTVEGQSPWKIGMLPIDKGLDYGKLCIIAGKTFCYIDKQSYDSVVTGTPDINVHQHYSGPSIDSSTISSAALRTNDLSADATAGDTYIMLALDRTNFKSHSWLAGEIITIADDSSTEAAVIQRVDTNRLGVQIWLENDLDHSYTTAANAKITSDTVYEVTVSDAWSVSAWYAVDSAVEIDRWVTLVEDSDYKVTENPFENDDVDGHIYLYSSSSTLPHVTAIRVTYSKYTNYWLEDNSGWYNIVKNQGQIVEVAEAEHGLYIFKKNPGAIYLLEGEPGPDATPGTLQLKLIHPGITAKAGTIQSTANGIYFGSVEQDKLELYFLPLVNREIHHIPKLSENYNPAIANLGSSSYSFTCRSKLVHGDMYMLTVTSQASGVGIPSDSEKCYICQAYYEGNTWKGRWVYWDEDQEEEYLADNPTHTIECRAKTIGYYYLGDHLYRVYITKDDSGTAEYNYYIARYCQADGHETALDKVYMLANNGTSDVLVTYNSGFYMDIRPRALTLPGADKLMIRAIHYDIQCTEGNASIVFYKNLDTTALLTLTITGLEDDAGSESFLRKRKLKFTCEYVEVLLRFFGVHSASAEEHLLFKDVWLEYVDIAAPGQITEVTGD